jgi:hypothetical protein
MLRLCKIAKNHPEADNFIHCGAIGNNRTDAKRRITLTRATLAFEQAERVGCPEGGIPYDVNQGVESVVAK